MNLKLFKCLFLLSLIAAACKNNKTLVVPHFDKDKAYSFVRKQTQFGPRVPNSAAHEACKEWMVNLFKSQGAVVIEQTFETNAYDKQKLNGTNIIASYHPEAKHRIMIASHWDSRPMCDQDPDTSYIRQAVLGADDGASGVGIILEMSRLLQQNELKDLGVDFILFDCEDYGDAQGEVETWCLGSQYWSRNKHTANYKADYGILLDMVGAANPNYYQEEYSLQFAPKVIDKIWKLAHDEGYGQNFIAKKRPGLVDDHLFVNMIAKIPMIDIINCPPGSQTGFVNHWHTHKDDMNAIDPLSLELLGKILIKLIYLEDQGSI